MQGLGILFQTGRVVKELTVQSKCIIHAIGTGFRQFIAKDTKGVAKTLPDIHLIFSTSLHLAHRFNA